MSNEEMKDCTRLPVVAWLDEGPDQADATASRRVMMDWINCGYTFHPLCRLTDAQARLAEKDARIAQLAAHARGKNKALANALKEIERFDADFKRLGEQYVQALHQITTLRTQLAQLQAAPAERGVVVLPALKVVEQAWGYDEGGNYAEGFAEGYNDAIDDVQRLNPAPATAEQVPLPALTVWEGAMPESNGKSNFTAVIMRKGADLLDGLTGGITIARSEYPGRVHYEADCMRYLIGELTTEPCILDYDADAHSGYVAPATADSDVREVSE